VPITGGELGLDKTRVVLRPHNPVWILLGQQECTVVRVLLGDLAREVVHVGSTSVPDLEAKPILDLAVAVDDDVPIDEIIARLENQGNYSYQGDQREDGGLLFVRGSGSVRTVHVHVVGSSSGAWKMYLRFLADPQGGTHGHLPACTRHCAGQSQQGARRGREARRDARPLVPEDARADHPGPPGPGRHRRVPQEHRAAGAAVPAHHRPPAGPGQGRPGQGREDLAKEALSRKAAAQQQIDEMEPQRTQLDEEEASSPRPSRCCRSGSTTSAPRRRR
jgi:GrpB-like predicted nucleotidyltransferase (UPF0157 family)